MSGRPRMSPDAKPPHGSENKRPHTTDWDKHTSWNNPKIARPGDAFKVHRKARSMTDNAGNILLEDVGGEVWMLWASQMRFIAKEFMDPKTLVVTVDVVAHDENPKWKQFITSVEQPQPLE